MLYETASIVSKAMIRSNRNLSLFWENQDGLITYISFCVELSLWPKLWKVVRMSSFIAVTDGIEQHSYPVLPRSSSNHTIVHSKASLYWSRKIGGTADINFVYVLANTIIRIIFHMRNHLFLFNFWIVCCRWWVSFRCLLNSIWICWHSCR